MTKENMDKLEKKYQSSYSCCGSGQNNKMNLEGEDYSSETKDIRETIRNQYAAIAQGINLNEKTIKLPDSKSDTSNNYTDYTQTELEKIPKGANLGLGSGNPIALTEILEGETVLDLGSGAGVDCFLAVNKVGKTGKVIGIDMTPQMIDKARKNAKKGNYTNVEFRLGEIEHMPIADSSVDLIISNCVINLSIDKAQVFREAYRVLKPGGRLLISDIVLNHEFPNIIKKSLKGTPGCVSGAMVKENYLNTIEKAGFEKVELLEGKIIKPRIKSINIKQNLMKRKLKVYNKEIEVELTQEEDDRLANSIMKAHIRAFKPL